MSSITVQDKLRSKACAATWAETVRFLIIFQGIYCAGFFSQPLHLPTRCTFQTMVCLLALFCSFCFGSVFLKKLLFFFKNYCTNNIFLSRFRYFFGGPLQRFNQKIEYRPENVEATELDVVTEGLEWYSIIVGALLSGCCPSVFADESGVCIPNEAVACCLSYFFLFPTGDSLLRSSKYSSKIVVVFVFAPQLAARYFVQVKCGRHQMRFDITWKINRQLISVSQAALAWLLLTARWRERVHGDRCFFCLYFLSSFISLAATCFFFFACLCEIGQFPTTVEFCFRLAASSDTA